MIELPSLETLAPRVIGKPDGDVIYAFPSENTDLVRVDYLFEAGSAYQPQLLCAAAANKLQTVATRRMDAATLAEFLDYRGVVVETSNDIYQSCITAYMLRRFAPEVLPVMEQMIGEPTFCEGDFVPWKEKKRQEIASLEMQSNQIARRLFYQQLFGSEHPLGRYATVQDVDRLDLETVRQYHEQHYRLDGCRRVVAGNVDGLEFLFMATGHGTRYAKGGSLYPAKPIPVPAEHPHITMPNSPQTSVRVGRVLPLEWSSTDYARLMLLTTALGGYFGSRLMQNIREEKGYTYGIYARTQIYRGVIVFYITANVVAGAIGEVEKEIAGELQKLIDQPISREELELVKTVVASDFVRSVDGVFERAARYVDMCGACVDERLTTHLQEAIKEATALQLQELAGRLLKPSDMLFCSAGAD